MRISEKLASVYGRYASYLETRGLDDAYRREFLRAMYDRARSLRATRPFRLAYADDYDRGCGIEEALSETGGSEWSCPEHGGSSPNRMGCWCPFPEGEGHLESSEEAEAATQAWVEAWEREHGSRFVPDEVAIARLMRHVWSLRRIRREVRRGSKNPWRSRSRRLRRREAASGL